MESDSALLWENQHCNRHEVVDTHYRGCHPPRTSSRAQKLRLSLGIVPLSSSVLEQGRFNIIVMRVAGDS